LTSKAILLIYLFGSQAEKAARYLEDAEIKTDEFSDLDVAVAFETPPSCPIRIYGRSIKICRRFLTPKEIIGSFA